MAKEIRQEKEVMLKDSISLEDYRKRVCDCLIKNQNCSAKQAEDLLLEYKDEILKFYEENFSPEAAACGMAMKYL